MAGATSHLLSELKKALEDMTKDHPSVRLGLMRDGQRERDRARYKRLEIYIER